MPLLKAHGRQRHPAVRRHPAALGAATSTRSYGIYTVAQPHGRPLRLHARRRLDARRSTTPTRRLRAAVKAELAALVDEFKGTPGVLDVAARQREQLRPVLDARSRSRRCREGERDAATRPLPLLAVRRDHRATSRRATRTTRWPSPTATCSTSTSSPRSARGSTSSAPTSTAASRPRDLFQVVKDKLGVPVMFTEFGADAFNAARDARGPGRPRRATCSASGRRSTSSRPARAACGNAIGGFIFQWSDGWWKFEQESRLDVHDTNASWPNGGYAEDFVEGENNMNEEWWGICAKGPPDARGLYRAATRAPPTTRCSEAFRLDPYAPGTDLGRHRGPLRRHRSRPSSRSYEAARRPAACDRALGQRCGSPTLRLQFETFSTGGDSTSARRADVAAGDAAGLPGLRPHGVLLRRRRGPARPTTSPARSRSTCSATCRVNPIDEIFYEKRGRPVEVVPDGRRRARRPQRRRHRAGQGLPRRVSLGRPLVPARRLLPHRPLPLGRRGRLLRPLPRGQLRRRTSTSTTATRPSASRSPASGSSTGSSWPSARSSGGAPTRPSCVKYRRRVRRRRR